jgi:hypothetical protein
MKNTGPKKEGWPETQAKKCTVTGQGQCGEESRITQEKKPENKKQAASAFGGSCKAPYSRE